MSATVYHEPYQVPAGILALAVHGVFFALLYFGFAWQAKPLEIMRVELWQSLPETVEAPAEKPMVQEVVQPAQPVKIEQPEIELPEKRSLFRLPSKLLNPSASRRSRLKRKPPPSQLVKRLLDSSRQFRSEIKFRICSSNSSKPSA